MFTFAKQYNQNQGLIAITKFNPLRAKADSFGFRRGYFLKSKKMYSLTKDQLRQLTDPKVKEWFPEVFYLPKDFTGWVKTNSRGNKKYLVFFKEGILQYGFDGNGTWFDYGEYKAKVSEDLFKATNEEVFEALKNEAVRRGFVKGVYFKSPVSGDNYKFTNIYFTEATDMAWSKNGGVIFDNGKWATIISTITKSEAEKLLNKKIID